MKMKELYHNLKATTTHRKLILNSAAYEFLEDYEANADTLDYYMMVKEFGELTVDEDCETISNLDTCINATLVMNKFKYSEIYKTLGLEYNPLWNVDGTEVTEYSDHVRNNDYGSRSGSTTIGAQNNDSTASVFNTGGGQKNTDKTTSNMGARTDSSSAAGYMDVTTDEAHTVTVTRTGNIGVTQTTKLLADQQDYVSINFLKMVISDIIMSITKRVYD